LEQLIPSVLLNCSSITGWMDGWMERWIEEWIEGWIHRLLLWNVLDSVMLHC